MPEGDTLHQAADRLDAALAGSVVVDLVGSHPSVRLDRRRIAGRTVLRVEARGKHLLMHFDNDWVLRTHLGMTGSWHLYGPEDRWRKTQGKARAVVTTPDCVAVCFSAPDVQLGPRWKVDETLEHLGPDLMDEAFDIDEYPKRARGVDAGATVADLLLDQRVAAGVGNVFKCEILFLEKLQPSTPVTKLSDDQLRSLAKRSQRLLIANRKSGRRITTGDRHRGRELWVYERAGRPCRRCGTAIESAALGDWRRVTYWCPGCQT